MERIDSMHSSGSSEDTRGPKPILISTPPAQHHHHQARKSISGIDILNGLKIMTSGSSILNLSTDSNVPPSPVPSQLIPEHHFNQIDDFDIREPIGTYIYIYIFIFFTFFSINPHFLNKVMVLLLLFIKPFINHMVSAWL